MKGSFFIAASYSSAWCQESLAVRPLLEIWCCARSSQVRDKSRRETGPEILDDIIANVRVFHLR
jgi:hypothetical protein